MTWYDVNFGANKSGLGTVGYREVNNVGGDAVARTTTGVVDAGDGMYGVDVVLNAATVSIQWDTGEAVPVFAVESINLLADLDAKLDIIDANVDLVLLDTTQLLIDSAQLLLDVAAVKSDTAQILLDTTQLLLDTLALAAQNALILADTTQLLLDTIALAAQNIAIFADTQMLRDIEDGHDVREILRLVVAATNNVLSGAEAASTQIKLTKLDGTGTRQLTNVDNDGNRLSIASRDFTP